MTFTSLWGIFWYRFWPLSSCRSGPESVFCFFVRFSFFYFLQKSLLIFLDAIFQNNHKKIAPWPSARCEVSFDVTFVVFVIMWWTKKRLSFSYFSFLACNNAQSTSPNILFKWQVDNGKNCVSSLLNLLFFFFISQ